MVDADREGDLVTLGVTVCVLCPLKVAVPLVENDTVGFKGVGDGDKLRVRVGDTVTEVHCEALRVRVRVVEALLEGDPEGLPVGDVDTLGEGDKVECEDEEGDNLGEKEGEAESVVDLLGVRLFVSLDWDDIVLESMAGMVEE